MGTVVVIHKHLVLYQAKENSRTHTHETIQYLVRRCSKERLRSVV